MDVTATKKDPWSVLGVSPGADDETIKRAFRTLAREHHPDRSDAPGAEERFRELVAAYELLATPGPRRRAPRPDVSGIVEFYAWLAGRQPRDEPSPPPGPPEPEPPKPRTAGERGVRLAAVVVLLYAVALLVLLLAR